VTEVQTTITVTDERIRDLLITAMEGGSNYWYQILKYEFPEGIGLNDFRAGGQFAVKDEHTSASLGYFPVQYVIPFTEGCAIVIGDLNDPESEDPQLPAKLDRDALTRGIQVMASKSPEHFADFLAENEDAATADVFLQLALFGDVVFC